MSLPGDPIILLSVINAKLRDCYLSLDVLCEDLNENKNEIIEKLSSAGYKYDASVNQFV